MEIIQSLKKHWMPTKIKYYMKTFINEKLKGEVCIE